MTVSEQLNRSHHVLLTTYRRDGRPVATVLGVAVDELGQVCMLTKPATGKVKRIRAGSRVTVVPCDGHGRVAEGATGVDGTARLLDDAGTRRVRRLMTRKYLTARLMLWTDRLRPRDRRWVGISVTL